MKSLLGQSWVSLMLFAFALLATRASAMPEIGVSSFTFETYQDGSTAGFGSAPVSRGKVLAFTVSNTGTASLDGLALTIDGTHAGDFSIVQAPSASLPPGGKTSFSLRFTPSAAGERQATLRIASNDVDENPFDLVLQGRGYVPAGLDFQILDLKSTGVAVRDLSTSNSGTLGMAASSQRLFMNTDFQTAVYSLEDLSTTHDVGRVTESICSDLGTGRVYVMAYNGVEIAPQYTSPSVNQLIALHPETGAPTAEVIQLSQTFTFGRRSSLFSGNGRIVVFGVNSEVLEIALGTGVVTNRGPMATPWWFGPTYDFRSTGVAEYFDGTLYLAYRTQLDSTIRRARVPDGREEIISTFQDLGDMGNWTVSTDHGRWYFQFPYQNQFNPMGAQSTLGRADAVFAMAPPTLPPVITSRLSVTGYANRPFQHQIRATRQPQTFAASGLPAGLSLDAATGLITGQALPGSYSITLSVTNAAGTTNATLTLVIEPNLAVVALFADPAYTDAAQVASVRQAMESRGAVVSTFTGVTAAAWDAAYENAQVVVLPEIQDWLPDEIIPVLNTRFSSGKSLVIAGGGFLGGYFVARSRNWWPFFLHPGYGYGLSKVVASDGFENSPPQLSWKEIVFSCDGFAPWLPGLIRPVYVSAPYGDSAVFQAGRIGVVGYNWNSGGDAGWDAVLGDMLAAVKSYVNAAEIKVTQDGSTLIDEVTSTVPFGQTGLSHAYPLTFTIENEGFANLTGLQITIDGAHAADFTVTTPPVSPVEPMGKKTFVVTFAPSALGERSAILHLASNDPDEPSFDFPLSGTGVVPVTEIAVEMPAGDDLVDGVSVAGFGGTATGSAIDRVFTVLSTGTGPLSSISAVISGPDAASFTLEAPPPAWINLRSQATLTIRFTPSRVGLHQATLRIHSDDADESPFDITLTGNGTGTLTGTTLRIRSLTANLNALYDHSDLTGYTRPGIAVGRSQVLVNGITSASTHALDAYNGGTALWTRLGALCSDLDTGRIYALARDGLPFDTYPAVRTVNQLLEIDPLTGMPVGSPIPLSTTLNLPTYNGGVFSGSGRVVLHDRQRVYDIALPSGAVTDLGTMPLTDVYADTGWAAWGVAEFFDGRLHLAYRANYGSSIIRRRVPDGQSTTIATFTDLGYLDAWSVSPASGRWYFNYSGRNQFGNGTRLLGQADAVIDHGPPATPPQISPPFAITADVGLPFQFQPHIGGRVSSITASGLPPGLSLQPSTGLISGTPSTAGTYLVTLTATNTAGSSAATLRLTVVNTTVLLSDDFDPGIDTPLWAAFSGTVTASPAWNTTGTGTTGNVLSFDGTTGLDRSATTIPLDTRSGGSLRFKIVLARGYNAGWHDVLEGREPALEYSTDGITFTRLGGPFTNRLWRSVSVPLPPEARSATTRFRWRQSAGHGNWAIEDVQVRSNVLFAEIALEQAAGVPLVSGGSRVDFGSFVAPAASDLVFTIRNTGTGPLASLAASLQGPQAADFTLHAAPPAAVLPGEAGTFALRFIPSALGGRSAEFRLSSNDSDENPFLLALGGQGITPAGGLDAWLPPSMPDRAPAAAPHHDGVPNLLKYAFNLDPATPDRRELIPGSGLAGLPSIGRQGSGSATVFRYEFLRRIGSGLVYAPEKSSTLDAASWQPLTVPPVVVPISPWWERVIYEEPVDPLLLSRCFGRVRVSLP